MAEYIKLFTTREVATLLWLVILFIYAICRKTTRSALWNLLECAFSRKLLILWLIIIGYVVLVTSVMSRLSFWKNIYIKDVVIWFITSGFIICANAVDKKDENYVAMTVKNKLSLALVSEFFISTFTFSIFIEIILIPVIAFVIMLETFSEINKDEQIRSCMSIISIVLGLFIIIGTVIKAIAAYSSLNKFDTLVSFAIPIVYLVLIIPLVEGLQVYSWYELLFSKTYFTDGEKNQVKEQKKIILRTCGFSVKKIRAFYPYCMREMYLKMSMEKFNKMINGFVI